MRYTTATAFAAMMGMSAIYAAPVGPNNTPGRDDLGMPLVYDDNSFQENIASQLHQRTTTIPSYQKRENLQNLAAIDPNPIFQNPNGLSRKQKRKNLQNLAAIDPNPIFQNHNGVSQKREANPQGYAESADDQALRLEKARSKSLHQTREANPQGYAESAADQTLRLLRMEEVRSKSLHQTREAEPQRSPTSKCPGYTCGRSTSPIDEISTQMQYYLCC
ncbi:hypothetical protein P3342_009123 [Pyrenophora teres f. teres]|uniref:Secreted protein n=1 Tax=Pyrenophora teres f. teres TaxID=97479 RepID=A0A6S6W6M9_9PLEO|nr:hypothetical protein PTNB73_09570 [Pyrenophora teres f. teres]KAK1908276.1 hypothetical protein P3342_009123 [Pyrenophora teres f. teres]CAE7192115.1 hypothetical protein PTTW11_07491 [Pyrenophora teres f. teres]